jgi:hypothetical protein
MTFALRIFLYAAAFTVMVVLATGAYDVPPEFGTALNYVVGYARFFETWFPVNLTLRLVGMVLGIEVVLAIYRALAHTAGAVGGKGD